MGQIALAMLGGYLLGAVPFGLLLVRQLKQVDIRSIGSGNIGATNAVRAAGRVAGISVLLLDGLKGVLSVTLVATWTLGEPTDAMRLACGLASVLGHNFPIFLKFRGGKGVATTIGVLLAAMPVLTGVALLIWLVVFGLFRYVSVASLTFSGAVPILQLLGRQELTMVLLGATLALLMLIRHRPNLERLVKGTEHKFGSGSTTEQGA